MKLVTQRGIKMKKTIIYYLVTAAMLLSLSSCGEKADDSSSESEKTETKASVTSESEMISENEPVSEPEPEIDLGFNGEFNEEVFEKICQNVRIGDKDYSFPCTLKDLGEDYELRNKRIDEELSYVSGALYYGSNCIATMTLDGDSASEDRDMTVVAFSVFDDDFFLETYDKTALNYNISFGGMKLRSTKEDITSKLGEPTSIIEHDDGSCKMDYAIDDNRMIIFRIADTGKVKSIALILGGI